MLSFKSILLLAAIPALSLAQTPPGLDPAVQQTLVVAYGANDISPAGEMVPRPETAQPPSLTLPASATGPGKKATLVMVDLDVNRGGTRVPNLHWISTNIDASSSTASISPPGPPADPAAGVTYRQPSPPKGDTPHRYVYLLYAQPEGFTPPAGLAGLERMRIGFDVKGFAASAGLGEPVAANYIMVQQ